MTYDDNIVPFPLKQFGDGVACSVDEITQIVDDIERIFNFGRSPISFPDLLKCLLLANRKLYELSGILLTRTDLAAAEHHVDYLERSVARAHEFLSRLDLLSQLDPNARWVMCTHAGSHTRSNHQLYLSFEITASVLPSA